jgi:predicted RNA-binding protein with PIN domain
MNLIGPRPDRGWPDPDRAVRRLIEQLNRHASATGEDVTVVFDRQPDIPPGAHGAALVTLAPQRGWDAADHEIVRMLAEDQTPDSSSVW